MTAPNSFGSLWWPSAEFHPPKNQNKTSVSRALSLGSWISSNIPRSPSRNEMVGAWRAGGDKSVVKVKEIWPFHPAGRGRGFVFFWESLMFEYDLVGGVG